MKYLVTAAEMRRYDSNTIEKIGIPACVLMERAALAAAEAIQEAETGKEQKRNRRALIMAGMGNNGGDGLALARLLSERAYSVEVWCVGDRKKASGEWRRQKEILRAYPVIFTDAPARDSYDVLVDALFGVGLSREITGEFTQAVDKYNQTEGFKLALDVPSGVDSDTGRVWGCAVRADATVTFGFCKRGLALYPGCLYAGQVRMADIGISKVSFFGEEPGLFAYDEEPEALLPKRREDGNKGTFGKVVLIAGSVNMAGAAVLAARAAYRIGAGMVKVITPKENRLIVQESVPEALLGTEEDLEEALRWADVAAVGPGIGTDERAESCLEKVICDSGLPLVMDADALNLLAEDPALSERLAMQAKEGRKIVLTPHVGEMSRITGTAIPELKKDLERYGRELAERLHAVVAAKDARTFICGEGRASCVNLTGNHGMATAGSGDVLTGIVAGLLAQDMSAFDAASVGVYLHGIAGERAVSSLGAHACMAADIAAHLRMPRECDRNGIELG